MPKFDINTYDKDLGHGVVRHYDTDKSTVVCSVPNGKLMKKPRKTAFYIYNAQGKTNQEKIREVTYNEAKELIRVHGTMEQYRKYFTVLRADGTFSKARTHITVDEYHRIKLIRNAEILNMSMTQFVEFLIDRYDDDRNHNKIRKNPISKFKYADHDPNEFTS